MDQPITIGLDLTKSVFQVHGVAADGRVIVRRQLRRSQVLGFTGRSFKQVEQILDVRYLCRRVELAESALRKRTAYEAARKIPNCAPRRVTEIQVVV